MPSQENPIGTNFNSLSTQFTLTVLLVKHHFKIPQHTQNTSNRFLTPGQVEQACSNFLMHSGHSTRGCDSASSEEKLAFIKQAKIPQ